MASGVDGYEGSVFGNFSGVSIVKFDFRVEGWARKSRWLIFRIRFLGENRGEKFSNFLPTRFEISL